MKMLDEKDIRDLVRKKVAYHESVTAWARSIGERADAVYKVLNGDGLPSVKILKALGYRKKIVFIPGSQLD